MNSLQEKYKDCSLDMLEALVLHFADHGKLEELQYFLTNDEFGSEIATQERINDSFILACMSGQMEIVEYLLTSKTLPLNADINCEIDKGLQEACLNGHLEVVRYLLTSPELKEHSNINAKNNEAFRFSVIKGHLNIADYLFDSPELDAHVDINNAFILANKYRQLEVLKYLIFEKNVQQNDTIKNALTNNPNKEVEQMFEKRDLLLQLNNELPSAKMNATLKKNKI